MKHLIGLLIAVLMSSGSSAQQGWYLKLKPFVSTDMTWAQEGGVAFGLGNDIIFGMGMNSSGGRTGRFWKYDPVNNTVSSFADLGSGDLGPLRGGKGGVGFALNGIGYAGLGGWEYSATDSIYRYNATYNQFEVWDPVIFPGGPRLGAICFVLNDKVYIGGGTVPPGSGPHNDFWSWSEDDGWNQMASMPAAITGGAAFSFGTAGYVVPNNSTALWRYDAATNQWTSKAPYPGGPRIGAVAFTWSGKAFVGTSGPNYTKSRTFYSYDPLFDAWAEAAPMWDSYGRTRAIAISHGGRAFVIGGSAEPGPNAAVADIWEIGQPEAVVPGVWYQRPFLPAVPRYSPVSFTLDDKFYLAGGTVGSGTWLTDLWMYDPAVRTWTARATMPAVAAEGTQAAVALDGTAYAVFDADNSSFWAYDPVADAWSALPDVPVGNRTGTFAFARNGKVFVGAGQVGGTPPNVLWAYDPQTASWEEKTGLPGSLALSGVAVISLADKDYVFGGWGNYVTNFMRLYDPSTDTWTVEQWPFGGGLWDAMSFGIGNRGYVAGGQMGGPVPDYRFREFVESTGTWNTLAPLDETRYAGTAQGIAGHGFLSCGKWNFPATNTNDLWEYIPYATGDALPLNGLVFHDQDLDCAHDPGEPPIEQAVLKVEPGGYYALTGTSGSFSMSLAPGAYTVEQTLPHWTDHCNNGPIPFEVIDGAPPTMVEFPDTAVAVGCDLGVQLSCSAAIPGFVHDLALKARNYLWSQTGEVTITLQLDPSLTFDSASPPPTSVNGNTLTWVIPGPYLTYYFLAGVRTHLLADVGLMGSTITSTATASSAEPDTVQANNAATAWRVVTASFDPNNKVAWTNSGSTTTWQVGEDEWVDYTINFQNTGTDTAHNVLITDTLPANLDPGSILAGGASHPFTWDLTGHGTVSFNFANIMLPDSNVNEPASHGFVGFRIKPVTPILPGDSIVNSANIYFDFNPAVITEPSVLVAEIGTGVEEPGADALSIVPNPTVDRITVQAKVPLGRVEVLSADGRLVLQRQANAVSVELPVGALAPGLYLVRSIVSEGKTLHQRFIKR
ncbi:MAG: T9SS type A sorting domain-containing protein [Bacteroidetes bacterium]|nr:T9SS type A sorting domain-containing protein [Bacteroidota bacterium]